MASAKKKRAESSKSAKSGKVDAADAQALAINWGTSTGSTWSMGDFTGDGAVGAADASILAANWGWGTGTSESAAVPEPGAAVSMVIGLLIVMMGGRKREG